MTRRRRSVASARLAEVLDAQLDELVPGEQRRPGRGRPRRRHRRARPRRRPARAPRHRGRPQPGRARLARAAPRRRPPRGHRRGPPGRRVRPGRACSAAARSTSCSATGCSRSSTTRPPCWPTRPPCCGPAARSACSSRRSTRSWSARPWPGTSPPPARPGTTRVGWTSPAVTALVEAAGFAVLEADGIGAVADLVPEVAVESADGLGRPARPRDRGRAGTPPSGRWPRTCTSSPSCPGAPAQRPARRAPARARAGGPTLERVFESAHLRRARPVPAGPAGEPDDHARRHGRVLRVRGPARPAGPAGDAGHRRRRGPRRRALLHVRGARPRRAVGDVVRPRPVGWRRGRRSCRRTSTATSPSPRRSSRCSARSARWWSRRRSTRRSST